MKKIIALLLVLVMAVGLVACGDPVGTKEVAGENKYPDARYDDAVFGSDEWDGSLPIVTDNQVLTVGMGANPNTLDYAPGSASRSSARSPMRPLRRATPWRRQA